MIKFLSNSLFLKSYKKMKKICPTEFKKPLQNFDKLTLTELNSTASFLKRIDRKFLLTLSQFKEIL
jgi:hypothetical protein